ncbi:MAG TPA: zinc ribbon domain-containing protein [Tepidisphaeraceae bacterium]|jgi:hypothetical protein|nr:zinc ribbon domain-containing protein [Tepidisphaeraceae bacterium]
MGGELILLIIVVAVSGFGLTTALFVWIAISIFRGVFGRQRNLSRLRRQPNFMRLSGTWCGQRKCGAANPQEAQFCRRCGNPLMISRRMPKFRRQAVMW